MTTIRALRETDWPRVADIFAQGIATGDASFETAVPDWSEFDGSRHRLLRLVATTDDGVVGWAAASPVSARPVYRGVVEHSVYVADAARGRGVGRELLNALVELAELCGVWTLRSGIFPENAASLAVHGQCGFVRSGVTGGWVSGTAAGATWFWWSGAGSVWGTPNPSSGRRPPRGPTPLHPR